MSKVAPNKQTLPQSGDTLFLTCRARSRKGRTALAMKWRLQSSKPVAATHVQSNPEQAFSRDLASIRGYFVPHLSGKGRTAFALKWRWQSSKPVAAIHVQSNPEQAFSRDLASIQGYFVPHLSGKIEEWQNCCCNEVALAEQQPKQPRTSLFW